MWVRGAAIRPVPRYAVVDAASLGKIEHELADDSPNAREELDGAFARFEATQPQLADAISQLCWMAHPDGHTFWYNRRWYEYTGTTPDQMRGWGWQSVHDPAELPRVLANWKAALASGRPYKPGDQVSYYIKNTPKKVPAYEAARLASDFDPQNRDENVDYYVRKLDELVKKFSDLTATATAPKQETLAL